MFREIARDQARTQFQHETTVWALLAPHQEKPDKQPPVPALLKR